MTLDPELPVDEEIPATGPAIDDPDPGPAEGPVGEGIDEGPDPATAPEPPAIAGGDAPDDPADTQEG